MIVILFVIAIVVSTYGGFSLIRVLKGSKIRLTGSNMDPLIRKMLIYILGSDLVWILAMLGIITYTVIDGVAHKWVWIGFEMFFRFMEIIAFSLFWYLLKKDVPREQSSASTASQHSHPQKEAKSMSKSTSLELQVQPTP